MGKIKEKAKELLTVGGPDLAGAYIKDIRPLDSDAMAKARQIQDSLTKPKGSLGKLEELSVRLAGIYRNPTPRLGRKMVFTMAADHGVTEEGVSAYPSSVTAQMVLNFANGGAAINVLARHADSLVSVIDMGVASDRKWPECVVNRKVRMGTRNMAKEPAMTLWEVHQAVETGAKLAIGSAESGVTAIGIGDMGIGNTTSASAITAVITGEPVRDVTGRGTGVDDGILKEKVRVIEQAIKVTSPNPYDGYDVLMKVGGYEIAGLAGVVLGAASRGVPVFIDGFVSCSAALAASVIAPNCKDYLIASHLSAEPGHKYALERLGLVPLLDLGMRLGEGTGAVLAFTIADASCKILREMATFDKAGVSRSIKEGKR
jgi:nicotinate-nucleotide--dimethylbenzimidazole phosphoribosyltransferase